jgi:fatty-acyl-CoA synthase
MNNGRNVGELINMNKNDKILCQVPFYHCFGLVMCNLASMYHGATVCIPS